MTRLRAWALLSLLAAPTVGAGDWLVREGTGLHVPAEVVRRPLGLPGWALWHWPSADRERLLALPGVRWAEADAPRRPDRLPSEARAAPPGRFDFWAQAGLPAAWEAVTGDPDVRLGLVDDALATDHPDLSGNVLAGRNYRYGQNLSVDDLRPYPCPGRLALPEHGTQVAGAMAAVGDNALGTAGAVWQAAVVATALGCQFGVAGAVEAYAWLAGQAPVAVNYSYSGVTYSQAEAEAVDALGAAGILLVASAGNGHGDHRMAPVYPAALERPNLIAVGALDRQDRPATWSAEGAFTVDLFAPGEGLYTTDVDGRYSTVSGTSFAAPLVTGTLALLRAADPGADAARLRAALLAGVRPLPVRGRSRTDGALDAAGALAALRAAPSPLPLLRDAVVAGDGDGDGQVDPGERFELNVVVENAGTADSGPLRATLRVVDGPLAVTDPEAALDGLPAQGEALLRFSLRADAFAAHRRALLAVDIDDGSGPVRRHFPLHLGALAVGEATDAILQADPYDHRHPYHFHPPNGRWVVELAADDPTGVGLALGGQRPRIHFLDGGTDVQDALVVASGGPLQRLDSRVLNLPSVDPLHLVVFRPPENALTDRAPTRYRLRLCGDPEAGGNRPPVVTFPGGGGLAVQAGAEVELRAHAEDPDGTVWAQWWEQRSGPAVEGANRLGDTVALRLERAGTYVFRHQASDDRCALGAAEFTVVVSPVAEANDAQRDVYRVTEGTPLNFQLPPTENFRLVSPAPAGSSYRNGQFSWSSPAPPGEYRLTFVNENGERRVIRVIVEARARGNENVRRGALGPPLVFLLFFLSGLARRDKSHFTL